MKEKAFDNMVQRLADEGIFDKQPAEGVVVFMDNRNIYALIMVDDVRYYLPLYLVNGSVSIGDRLTVERGENTRVKRVIGFNPERTQSDSKASN